VVGGGTIYPLRERSWPATATFPHTQKWEPGGAASLPVAALALRAGAGSPN